MIPANLAESELIAQCLVNRNDMYEAISQLDSCHFDVRVHRLIFDAMKSKQSNDVVIISDVIGDEHTLYLFDLIDRYVSGNIGSRIAVVKEKYALRKIDEAAKKASAECGNPDVNAEDIGNRLQSAILEATSGNKKASDPEEIKLIIPKVFEKLENIQKGVVRDISSGLRDLDEILYISNGEVICIAARPGQGKTALGLKIAGHAALVQNKLVVIFSLEMPKVQIATRLVFINASLSLNDCRAGTMPKKDYPKLSMAASQLFETNIVIDDTPAIKDVEIINKCRKIELQKGKIGLIMVDYLQLAKTAEKTHSREQEVATVSRNLKTLAKMFNCPVLELAQLSRAMEVQNRPPQLSDLRESGGIEQDADAIVFIYRPEAFDSENPELKNVAHLIVAKQRDGSVGVATTVYHKETMRFLDKAKDDYG